MLRERNPHLRNYRLQLRVCCALADGIARPSHRWLPHLFSTYLLNTSRSHFTPIRITYGMVEVAASKPRPAYRLARFIELSIYSILLYFSQQLSEVKLNA